MPHHYEPRTIYAAVPFGQRAALDALPGYDRAYTLAARLYANLPYYTKNRLAIVRGVSAFYAYLHGPLSARARYAFTRMNTKDLLTLVESAAEWSTNAREALNVIQTWVDGIE